MPLVKPASPPGFLAQATQVQARGNWFAGNLVRWRTGLLEKVGGWRRLIEDVLPAVIRRMHGWLDLKSKKNLLIATDTGVHLLVQDTLYALGRQIDLQGGYIPEIGLSPDATKFSVAINSKTVTVKTPVAASAGGSFLLRLPISIGGRTILADQFFKVTEVIPDVGFKFDMLAPSVYAETDTYGVPLLENNIVNVMTVTWKAHNFVVGSQIRFAQDTSLRLGIQDATTKKYSLVDFSAPGGTVITVDTVVDANKFTFKMGTLGTGDGTGGPSHQVFLGANSTHPTGPDGVITGTPGVVIGLGVQHLLGDPQKQAWFLGNLGEHGLVLGSGGPLEVYKPPITTGPFLNPVGPTTIDSLPDGSEITIPVPMHSNGMIVAMPQGQVILFGSEAEVGEDVIDPLMIRWSHPGTYDVYMATVRNQAGSMRLSRGSRIVGMIQAPQTTLIFTDIDVWQMSYVGPPLIYGFTVMGSGCGLVAPHAVGTVGRLTVWQGQKNFWMFDTAVSPVQCTVWDYVFRDVDQLNANKCHAAPNSTTNELAFYFPSQSTMINVDRNLLLFSQKFDELSKWVLTNVSAAKFSVFHALYVYEPQYENSGWFMDAGLTPITWWDRDLQSRFEEIVESLAPDGTDTTFLLQETAVDGTHSISQTVNKIGERTTYTLSIYVHKNSTRNLTLRAVTDQGEVYATFNTATGNLLAGGVTSPKFAFIKGYYKTDDPLGTGEGSSQSPGNGWRRLVLVFTSDDSDSLDIFFNITNGTNMSYLGEPPKGVLIWGAQLVLGSDPLDYQPTEGVQRQNETRRYVKLNVVEGLAWDSGRLSRSAWLDESVWGPPLGADITVIPPVQPPFGQPTVPTAELERLQMFGPMRNVIQQHERGFDDDDLPMTGVFAETGYTELGDGTAMMLVDQVHPDMKWFGRDGSVDVSMRATNYPQGPSHLYGPFPMTAGTQWFNPRVRARYVSVRYDWEPRLGFSARVGLTTFHVKPAGRLP